MRRLLVVAGMLMCCGLAWGVNQDNRAVGADPVRALNQPADDQFLITFSTTIPAANVNTAVLLLGTHTATSVYWPPLVAVSTAPRGVNGTTTTYATNGGRSFFAFQVIGASQPVTVGFTSSLAAYGGPMIQNNGWWPPVTMPYVYQGPIYINANSTATITGYILTEKSRR